MQVLSVLYQISNRPVLCVRAMRSCIDLAGHWIAVSDELARQARYTHIFSSIHGLFGVLKLRKLTYSGFTHCQLGQAWMVAMRVKKFASSIAWFCKAGRDLHYWGSEWVGWTSYLKIIRVPFDCVSLSFGVIKVTRVFVVWVDLQTKTKNDQVVAESVRLQEKMIKKILYCGAKAFDISSLVLEQASSVPLALLSLNSLVSFAIKTTVLFYTTFSSSVPLCKMPTQQHTKPT